MGVVQQKSGNTGATAAPATFNVSLDSGTVAGAGRYLVIIVSCDNVVDTPAGFTKDEDQVNNAGHYVFRKSTVNGETTWAITPGAGGGAASWWAQELDELDASDPVDANAHTSQGTGASGSTWSTGTTGTPTQDDVFMIASFSISTSGEVDVNATGFTNDYVEQADEFTTKTSGTDIGLYGATKTLTAAAAQECTATFDASGARTGIIIGYKIAAAAEESEVTIAGSLPAPLSGALTAQGSALAAVAGSLPAPLNGALTATASASATIAGSLPALAGALTVAGASAAALAGSLPALAGALSMHAGERESAPSHVGSTAFPRVIETTVFPRRIEV